MISFNMASKFIILCFILFALIHWYHKSENISLLALTKAPIYQYQIINRYPHSTNSFTEGFVYSNGEIYESTGRYHESTLQHVKLKTGKIIKQYTLADNYFAEGITELNDKIYQLTYKNKEGFVYDKKTFRLLNTFHYATEGWGLTNDGKQLIMSDGSAKIKFLDSNNVTPTRDIIVHDDNRIISGINEMQYIHGKIYANIYPTDIIAIISPQDGQIEGWIPLPELKATLNLNSNEFVLNGIAYHSKNNSLLVTGKCWPYIYEITINTKER